MRPYEPVTIDEVAASALACEGIVTRHLTQTFLRQTARLADVPVPETHDSDVRAVAAALMELFAARRQETPPFWAKRLQRVGDPIFLFPCKVGSFTYQLCLAESPPPLRKRRLYAPDNYLTFA